MLTSDNLFICESKNISTPPLIILTFKYFVQSFRYQLWHIQLYCIVIFVLCSDMATSVAGITSDANVLINELRLIAQRWVHARLFRCMKEQWWTRVTRAVTASTSQPDRRDFDQWMLDAIFSLSSYQFTQPLFGASCRVRRLTRSPSIDTCSLTRSRCPASRWSALCVMSSKLTLNLEVILL